MTYKEQSAKILAKPGCKRVVGEFARGIKSGRYYRGTTCFQLYFDLRNETFWITEEVSENSYVKREDGSLIQILRTSRSRQHDYEEIADTVAKEIEETLWRQD